MTRALSDYAGIVGEEVIERLRELAKPLAGASIVHVNSTRVGGGVAEILGWMVPLMTELGLEASWEVVEGDAPFFNTTKALHNGIQGNAVPLDDAMIAAYDRVQERNAARLGPTLEAADFVLVHDPQPAGLLGLCGNRKGRWLWRCHIDASSPHPPVWEMVSKRASGYEGTIFSLEAFAHELPGKRFIIAPSIDPLSPKNEELGAAEVSGVFGELGLDPALPLVTQVSRFDRFKDPVGVIEAFRHGAKPGTAQLALAGGGADDDPEGAEVLAEVRRAAAGVAGVHVLLLPPDAHRTINALQRASRVILQKSLREGFGLTVTEALWKGKPVIGGNTGGITLQVLDGETGYLVDSPAEAGEAIGRLVADPALAARLGAAGKAHVTKRFLLTRELAEHLEAMAALR